jgi:large subunit ribosomal protein L21
MSATEVKMYAIVRTGGKQYRVEEGSLLRVEKLPREVGETVELDEVLLISGEDGVFIPGKDSPAAKVTATVVRQAKGPKVVVFKYKPKKGYHRKQGHRQLFTELRIDSISLPGTPAPSPAGDEPGGGGAADNVPEGE